MVEGRSEPDALAAWLRDQGVSDNDVRVYQRALAIVRDVVGPRKRIEVHHIAEVLHRERMRGAPERRLENLTFIGAELVRFCKEVDLDAAAPASAAPALEPHGAALGDGPPTVGESDAAPAAPAALPEPLAPGPPAVASHEPIELAPETDEPLELVSDTHEQVRLTAIEAPATGGSAPPVDDIPLSDPMPAGGQMFDPEPAGEQPMELELAADPAPAKSRGATANPVDESTARIGVEGVERGVVMPAEHRKPEEPPIPCGCPGGVKDTRIARGTEFLNPDLLAGIAIALVALAAIGGITVFLGIAAGLGVVGYGVWSRLGGVRVECIRCHEPIDPRSQFEASEVNRARGGVRFRATALGLLAVASAATFLWMQ